MLTMTSSGRLMIGTSTSPQRMLHVYNASNTAPVRFENTNGYCEINPTTTTWTCTSDENLKQDILTIDVEDSLNKLKQLRPVTFKWKNAGSNSSPTFGLIAQEVERIYPDFVTTDTETGLKAVSYGSFTPVLIAAIQKLEDRVSTLEQAVAGARNAIASVDSGLVAMIQATVGRFRKIEVEEGIQIKDRITGEKYCVTIANGEWERVRGTCADIAHEDTDPIPTDDPIDTGGGTPVVNASSTEPVTGATSTEPVTTLEDDSVSSDTTNTPNENTSDQGAGDQSSDNSSNGNSSDSAPVSSESAGEGGGE
jgi:hypothetical protein